MPGPRPDLLTLSSPSPPDRPSHRLSTPPSFSWGLKRGLSSVPSSVLFSPPPPSHNWITSLWTYLAHFLFFRPHLLNSFEMLLDAHRSAKNRCYVKLQRLSSNVEVVARSWKRKYHHYLHHHHWVQASLFAHILNNGPLESCLDASSADFTTSFQFHKKHMARPWIR